MKTRIISGLIMAPLILVCVFRGLPLTIAAFIIGVMGIWELFRGFGDIAIKPNLIVAYVSVIALYAIHFLVPNNPNYLTLWVVLSVMASMISSFDLQNRSLQDAMATLTGILYVGFFSYHMVLIAGTEYGVLVWMAIITAFCTDIGAYFAGSFLGKRKLCPNLSPKKTIEGSIGGILSALIVSIVFGLIAHISIFPHIIIMAVLGSIMSQLGDLTASAFKRKMDIKDFGNLIPGHGGILDRFDSVLFTAPTIYYYIVLVMRG